MNPNYAFQVRVTGVLIEDGRLLLVKQKLSEARSWSLPGGRLERGETLEQGVVREIKEETGRTSGWSACSTCAMRRPAAMSSCMSPSHW
ncbi:MAG: NUDIX hydrolase [Christensenellaceae bacterium]|nr:NUDIX hydrolase [Christensenellaceae bacterium]